MDSDTRWPQPRSSTGLARSCGSPVWTSTILWFDAPCLNVRTNFIAENVFITRPRNESLFSDYLYTDTREQGSQDFSFMFLTAADKPASAAGDDNDDGFDAGDLVNLASSLRLAQCQPVPWSYVSSVSDLDSETICSGLDSYGLG